MKQAYSENESCNRRVIRIFQVEYYYKALKELNYSGLEWLHCMEKSKFFTLSYQLYLINLIRNLVTKKLISIRKI